MMNIFVLDSDPVLAARAQHNKHVIKMVLETAQLLCSPLPRAPYKPAYVNHPCAIWTRATRGNFNWLIEHGIALSDEYTFRYGKVHKSRDVILHCADRINEIPDGPQLDHVQVVPAEYVRPSAVEAYRMYYRMRKVDAKSSWGPRARPDWLQVQSVTV